MKFEASSMVSTSVYRRINPMHGVVNKSEIRVRFYGPGNQLRPAMPLRNRQRASSHRRHAVGIAVTFRPLCQILLSASLPSLETRQVSLRSLEKPSISCSSKKQPARASRE
jgi:hypothetical protein